MQWHQQQLVTLLVIGISGAAFADDELAELNRKMAPFRKLQQSGPSAECLSACPALNGAMAGINQDQMSLGGNPSMTEMKEMMQKMYADTYRQMCAHKPAFECMAANTEVCSPQSSDPSPGLGAVDLVEMSAELDCMCTACPSMPAAMGSLMGTMSYLMMSAFQGFSAPFSGQVATTTTLSPGASQTQAMEMFCELVEPFKCVSNSSSCDATKAHIQASNFTNVSAVLSLEPACVQSGYALSIPDTADTNETHMSGALRVRAIFSLVGSFFAAFACMN